VGHAHVWERAVQRRRFLRTAAGAAGLALTANAWLPALARAASPKGPRPIPGGIQPLGPGSELFHVFFPDPGAEPSLITDFDGMVGLAHVEGTGVGTDTATGASKTYTWDVDNRFMVGKYIGLDGQPHDGTFGFI